MQTHLWSQSISVKSSRGYQALLLLPALLLPSLILFSCGGGGGGGGDKTPAVVLPTPPPDNIYLWTTSGTHTGALGGIDGANSVCEGDADKIAAFPTDFTHQAVLAVADPAFHPDSIIPNADTREVQRPDGTPIAATYQAFAGSAAEVTRGVTPTTTEQIYWTGLLDGRGIYLIGAHCNNWRSASGTVRGDIGHSQDAVFSRLGTVLSSCDNLHHLLCVSHLVTK